MSRRSLLVAALAALSTLPAGAQEDVPPDAPVARVVRIERGEIASIPVPAMGQAEAIGAVPLVLAAGGMVALASPSLEGGEVRAGDVLVRLGSGDAELERATAETRLVEARADLAAAEGRSAEVAARVLAELDEARRVEAQRMGLRRALAAAVFELERMERHIGSAIPAGRVEAKRDEIERIRGEHSALDGAAEAARARARAGSERLRGRRAEEEAARAGLGAAEAALEAAAARMAAHEVVAPFDGRIAPAWEGESAAGVAAGEFVAPGRRVGWLVPAEGAVELAVETVREAGGRVGSEVRIRPPEGPEAWAGRIVGVGPGSAENRVVLRVRAAAGPRVGLAYLVELPATSIPAAIAIPVAALRAADRVWIVGPGGLVEERAIEPGRRVGDRVLIDGGLEEGDEVLLDAPPGVAPGSTVAPVRAGG